MIKDVYPPSVKFLAPLTQREIYKAVVEEAIKLSNAKYGSIFMSVSGKIQRVYTSYPKLYKVIPRKDGITNLVYVSSKPSIRSINDPLPFHPKLKKMQISSDISVPLIYNNITMGVLSVLTTNAKFFSNKDLDVLTFFTPLAAISIQNGILYERLYKSSKWHDLFISLVSHQIKTLLTSIILYTQAILREIEKGKTPSKDCAKKLLAKELSLSRVVKHTFTDYSSQNRKRPVS